MTERQEGLGEIYSAMTRLNETDLTNKIVSELQAQASSSIDHENRGSFVQGGEDVTNQNFQITDITRSNMQVAIKSRMEKHLANAASQNNSIINIRTYMPCGPVNWTQEGVARLLANDLSQDVTKIIVESDEYKKLSTKMDAETKQKNTDTIVGVAEEISKAVQSLGWAAALATGGLLIVGLFIAFFVVILIIGLFRALLKGGKKKEDARVVYMPPAPAASPAAPLVPLPAQN